jgi:uncharacterized protein (TIGR02246 family)
MSKSDIEAGEKQWLAAFNSADASGVANLYTQDARMMAPNADIIQGRSEIEGFVKEFVQTGAQLSFDLLTVHEAPDLCVAVGRYQMDFPSGAAPQDLGKYIEVWKRQSDGSWLVVDDIFNSNLEAPSA